MATVINTPAQNADNATAGWAVAVVVLVAAVLIALFVWPGFVRPAATQQAAPGANINVQLPQTGGQETGGNTGGSGSGNTGGSSGGAEGGTGGAL